MTRGAELLLLLLAGMALFRLARPLRDRLEAWFERNFPNERRNRVVELRRRRDGGFGAEDLDGDD
ncbi:MAG TPA: hypothetical protein VII78_06380 [Myxococcota bacterium]|jgi:DNA repair photolyase